MTMDRHRRPGRLAALAIVAFAFAFATATASAAIAAAPSNTGAPTISGTAKEGQTLTAGNGSWDNSPTSFSYRWQRCAAAGGSCADISGATSKTYQLTSADVDHRIRVIVTATNTDGSSSANSRTTAVVAASNGPTNTAKPTISGTPAVGEQLTATNGTWTGGVTSYSYQWQSCSASLVCADISGANGQSYNVRTADIGSSIRVQVTAKSSSGSSTASSDATAIVVSAGGGTTTIVTSTHNRAPSISFLSLKRVGGRIYARFRVCDDSPGKVTIIEHDAKAHVQGYTRRFAVTRCGTYSRHWTLIRRFNHAGRFTVSLRAMDKSRKVSRTVHRSLTFR